MGKGRRAHAPGEGIYGELIAAIDAMKIGDPPTALGSAEGEDGFAAHAFVADDFLSRVDPVAQRTGVGDSL